MKYGYLLANSYFCCSLAALNFDTLLGACWGGDVSGATSSCFRSNMVGRAGGTMVRWGTAEGIGSFSTTVPENACRAEINVRRPHVPPHWTYWERFKSLSSPNAACSFYIASLWPAFNDCSGTHGLNLKRLLWEFCYVLIKGSEAQRCDFPMPLHNIGVLQIPTHCNWD